MTIADTDIEVACVEAGIEYWKLTFLFLYLFIFLFTYLFIYSLIYLFINYLYTWVSVKKEKRDETGIYDLFIIGNSASLPPPPPMFLKNQNCICQGHEIRSEVHEVAWVTVYRDL